MQGAPGEESAGYHGYWITDFTRVDPHFGTNEDMQAFVDAAHARGMKVYLDIITNHTADVIAYRECPDASCAYRSRADYPYSTARRAPTAQPSTRVSRETACTPPANFAKLTRADFAYTPFVPAGEAQGESARLAQRSDLVPQPRQHDVQRREHARWAISSASTIS